MLGKSPLEADPVLRSLVGIFSMQIYNCYLRHKVVSTKGRTHIKSYNGKRERDRDIFHILARETEKSDKVF
jgi:hypothetical protein